MPLRWPSLSQKKKKLKIFRSLRSKFFLVSLLLTASLAQADVESSTEHSWDSKWTLDVAYPPSMVINYWAGIYEKFNLAKLRRLNRELAPYEHGYIRPHIRFMSSVKVNNIEPRFDLYPFTFLGLTGGWTFSHRSMSGIKQFEKYTDYNCRNVSCDGWNYLPFVEGKFKWGYGSVFGVFFLRRDWAWTKNMDSETAYDPTSGMVFHSSFDNLNQFWVLVGTKVSEDSKVLVRYRYMEWDESAQYKRDASLLYALNFNDRWSGGTELTRTFRSDGFNSITFALRVTWNLRKTPAAEDALN